MFSLALISGVEMRTSCSLEERVLVTVAVRRFSVSDITGESTFSFVFDESFLSDSIDNNDDELDCVLSRRSRLSILVSARDG